MDSFSYNNHGQQMTGFSNSIDHSLFGHWSNPEYQDMFKDDYEFELMENSILEINKTYDEFMQFLKPIQLI